MSRPLFDLSGCRAAALWCAVGVWGIGGADPGRAADPAVSNLKAVPRPGTMLVDLTYDLAGDAAGMAVSLQISGDGGATFAVSAASAAGALGAAVRPGLGKALTWNAAADWNGQYSTQVRFKISAGLGVAPPGFALIPLGGFSMGDALGEGDSDELPVREVVVSAFYLGKTEVTKGEWDAVRTWARWHGYEDLSPGEGIAADHPVQMVSWWDAVKWCNARSEKEGLAPCYLVGDSPLRVDSDEEPSVNWAAAGYRLPTEAEWEKAARGGLSGKRFPWGNTISHSQANYWSDSAYAYDVSPTRGYHPAHQGTAPAGSFAANGYGLFGMAGNVWEYCWDRYREQAYESAGNFDPKGPTSGESRVSRGGGWDSDAIDCRMAFRMVEDVVDQYDDTGFRAARAAVPQVSATSANTVVDARNPLAMWTLFSAAEAGLPAGDANLLSLNPLDKLAVSTGAESRDGKALQFTAVDEGSTTAERTIEGPAEVSFWWRVSSEEDFDFFEYFVDGVSQESSSGDSGWMQSTFRVGVGRHVVRWTYSKDESVDELEDAAYLDELVIKPVENYSDLEVSQDGEVVTGKVHLDYGKVWQGAEEVVKYLELANTGTAVLWVTASLTADGGFVFENGRNQSTQSLGAGESRTLSLILQTGRAGRKAAALELAAAGSRTAPPTVTLSGSVEVPLLQVAGTGPVVGSELNSGSTAAWESATTTLPGGGSGAALKAGRTLDLGHSALGVGLEGPGLLRWQWKVSSQQDADWLLCEVDGVEVAGISGTAERWQSQVVQIPAGAEVRWIYRKDGANQAGGDSGYLADVRFDAFAAAPVSFRDWSAAKGGIEPLALTGPGKIQGVFAWLGGFDPAAGPGPGQYVPTVSGGFFRYRYAISKTADGQVQPQVSRDLATWTSRGLSQTVLSETPAAAAVELAIPAEGKWYTRLKTGAKAGVGDAPVGFALIPAGAFSMGDSFGEGDSDERPVRQVQVSGFYLGKTEVTKGEWDAVRTWAAGRGYADLSQGAGKAANHPVTDVSWWDAVKWCNARSEKEGLVPCYAVGGSPMRTGTTVPTVSWTAKGYRLPTEAEWEKAARGGLSGKRFPWGDTIRHSQANYYSSSDDAYDVSPTEGYHPSYEVGDEPYTSPAGSFPANGYGLQDMAGNVWEWCWDLYETYASGAQTDPRGAASGSDRVFRGGSWNSNAIYCRAAYRSNPAPAYQYYFLGFRVLRSSVP